MTIWNVVILTGIVAAFGTFGVVLAWAEHQTRRLSHHNPPVPAQDTKSDDSLKMAA